MASNLSPITIIVPQGTDKQNVQTEAETKYPGRTVTVLTVTEADQLQQAAAANRPDSPFQTRVQAIFAKIPKFFAKAPKKTLTLQEREARALKAQADEDVRTATVERLASEGELHRDGVEQKK